MTNRPHRLLMPRPRPTIPSRSVWPRPAPGRPPVAPRRRTLSKSSAAPGPQETATVVWRDPAAATEGHLSIVDGAGLKDQRLRTLFQRSPGPVKLALLSLSWRSCGTRSGRRSPDNRQGCCVEEPVFRRGGSADCSGGFRFLPDEIVVGWGEYNLPVRVTRDVPVCVLDDFGRHGAGQGQASRIFQKPCPCLGIEPVPLVLEAHARRLCLAFPECEYRPDYA
jgi:hypothetical protein